MSTLHQICRWANTHAVLSFTLGVACTGVMVVEMAVLWAYDWLIGLLR